jgi:hypothetical protein
MELTFEEVHEMTLAGQYVKVAPTVVFVLIVLTVCLPADAATMAMQFAARHRIHQTQGGS